MSKNLRNSIVLVLGTLSFMVHGAQAMDMKSDPIAVVELFTSQGCSSCPPADAFLSELSKRDDVITLAYHVDYWNYIGWKDTFSAKKHSMLQRKYAKQTGRDQIYTPQLVVNGGDDFVGSHQSKINAALEGSSLPISMGLGLQDDTLHVNIPAQSADIDEAIVWLVSYRQNAEVDIKRGENRGKKLNYSSIVYERQIVGMWRADEATKMMIPVPEMMEEGVDGLAVLVQEKSGKGLPGAILGAAALSR